VIFVSLSGFALRLSLSFPLVLALVHLLDFYLLIIRFVCVLFRVLGFAPPCVLITHYVLVVLILPIRVSDFHCAIILLLLPSLIVLWSRFFPSIVMDGAFPFLS
jgi:hypothetical protein